MANPEHVEIVKQGTEAIEKWREENPGQRLNLSSGYLNDADLIRANLSGADLSGARLSNANLGGADLSGANMRSANLGGASLKHTNLSGTNLREANLSDANLREANLFESDLRRSCLESVYLGGAYLRGANLSGADLRDCECANANCANTNWANVDLSETKSLEEIIHRSPSTVGIDTLEKSRGKIPDVFLRGCGVPEEIILFSRTLVGKPIEFYSCFISYSHKNEEFAKRLHASLQSEQLRVWYAPKDMQGGKKSIDQIDSAIRVHDKLLLVLSKQSMDSEWVKTEIRRARKAELRDKRQKLFPIRLVSMEEIKKWECFDSDTGKDLAVEVREYHIPDFSKWKDHDSFEEAFRGLLGDLRKSEEE